MSSLVSLKETVAPAAEPATAADLRDLLRLDDTTEDSLLALYITSARVACEAYTGQATTNRTLRALYDGTPDGAYLELPMFPLVSVTSVEYLLAGDTAFTTMSAADYRVDTDGGRVILANGKAWPTGLDGTGAFRVTYVAGYGAAASAVPQGLREAVKLVAGQMFEQRGSLGEGSDKLPAKLPSAAKMLLQPYIRTFL